MKRLDYDAIPYPNEPARDVTARPREMPAPLPLGWGNRGMIALSESFLIEQGQMNGPSVIAARVGLLDFDTHIDPDDPSAEVVTGMARPFPTHSNDDTTHVRAGGGVGIPPPLSFTDSAARLQTLPVRAPIRRERDVRWASVVMLVSLAATVAIWGGLGLLVARALTR